MLLSCGAWINAIDPIDARIDVHGREYQAGPYYVRTWYIDGEKHTERIPRDQVPRIERQIRNYQKMKDLFDELLDVTEQLIPHQESIPSN